MEVSGPPAPASRVRSVLRFGVFEADSHSGELHKNGLKVKLTGQPFQVLAMLLERPGEVVAREELRKRLWPADTFVDFDHSLNTAINKIREALGDSAESPRFVETVPRRGYRFIAPVEAIESARAPRIQEAPLDQAGGAREAAEPPPRKRGALALGATLGLLVVALLAWYGWQRWPPKPELTQQRLTTNSSEIPVWASAISPNGRYLVYSDDSGIYLRVIDTAETHILTTPADSKINKLAWYPDGDRLLASGEAGERRMPSLWSISILGGAPQKLRDDASDGGVLWDGTGIVFVGSYGKEIWQMGPEGQEARKLLTASEGESFGAPVVIGARLWYAKRYASADNWDRLEYEIESRDLRGGPPTILLPKLRATSEVLLPSGRFIFSRIDRPDPIEGGSLWEISADLRTGQARGNPRRIADWADFRISGLSATADGKRLAYLKEKVRLSVFLGDLESNGLRLAHPPRRLTLSDSSDNCYDWTPDSKSVLFDSNRNGTWDSFKQRLDQRTAERLVAGGVRPAMGPDGASVIYFTDPKTFRYPQLARIMRVAFVGGPPQMLGDVQNAGAIRCARTANLCVVSESDNKQLVLYTLNPVKGKGRELFRAGPLLLPKHDRDWDWTDWFQDWDLSPDGSTIALATRNAQGATIQIRSLAGGPPREVNLAGWANPMNIHWSPDGKGWFLIALSTMGLTFQRPDWPSLIRVDLAGKVRVLRQESTWVDPIPSPDGRHLALQGHVATRNVWMLGNF